MPAASQCSSCVCVPEAGTSIVPETSLSWRLSKSLIQGCEGTLNAHLFVSLEDVLEMIRLGCEALVGFVNCVRLLPGK